MAAVDMSVLPMAFCVLLFARSRLMFSCFWISREFPRAPIEPRVISIRSRALAMFEIAESTACLRAIDDSPSVTGLSSAARSWLKVSSTFWVLWVLAVAPN
ncbi:hypothetical protein D3C77_576500 [compost metagenome]